MSILYYFLIDQLDNRQHKWWSSVTSTNMAGNFQSVLGMCRNRPAVSTPIWNEWRLGTIALGRFNNRKKCIHWKLKLTGRKISRSHRCLIFKLLCRLMKVVFAATKRLDSLESCGFEVSESKPCEEKFSKWFRNLLG